MSDEIVFSDLEDLVVEKQNITESGSDPDRWMLFPYSSSLCDGNMLLAKETVRPADITLRLGLSGRYHVYIGLFNDNWDDYLHVKTSGEKVFTGVRFNKTLSPKPRWKYYENIQEVYLMTADLTGQDLIVSKPSKNSLKVACLAWVRCVKADDTVDACDDFSKPENKRLHIYFDLDDAVYYGDVSDADRCCMFENAAVHSDAAMISRDFVNRRNVSENAGVIPVVSDYNGYTENQRGLLKIYDEVVSKRIAIARKAGIPYYAAFRIQVSDFIMFPEFIYNCDLSRSQPEYRCVWRDGTRLDICSYAYEYVRSQVIDLIISNLKAGYDGVTLLVQRGITVGFEQPVVDLFNERYPGADCRLLPLNDSRVTECRSKFFTDFVKELRTRIDQVEKERGSKLGIHIVAGTDLYNTKEQGIDLEELARLGLIDGISQDNMLVWEDLSGCMSDSDPALIDIRKYKNELRKRQIIRRDFKYIGARAVESAKAYIELCKKYGIRFFGAMDWEHSVPPQTYIEDARNMYGAGADGLLRWNAGQMTVDPAVWNVSKRLGHKDAAIDPSKYIKHYRTLKINGKDISLFNPEWRG